MLACGMQHLEAQMSTTIYFYSSKEPYFEFSNFFPCSLELDGAFWPTVEHYFQAAKFSDFDYREQIRMSATPWDARTLGQSRALPIRPDWNAVRVEVMLKALRLKFQRPELRALLLSTGTYELVENSPHDAFWGAGPHGRGQNMLGRLLMRVRAELQFESIGSEKR